MTERLILDPREIEIENFLAAVGKIAGGAIRLTIPGVADLHMSDATAFQLAARLLVACKYSAAGAEKTHPHDDLDGHWLSAILHFGEQRLQAEAAAAGEKSD